MSITKEKKATIFAQHGGNAANTGSIEGQIALLTERILDISNHLKINKKIKKNRLIFLNRIIINLFYFK